MDIQIGIYLDKPTGQIIQVSYTSYKTYWRNLGYQILDEAKELPGFESAVHPELLKQPRMI